MATEIYINTDLKDLTANAVANKNRPTQVVRLPQVVEGETLDIELSLVNSGGGYDSRSGDSGVSLAVAVSAKGAAATSGTFTLTASTETTAPLAWNASAEAVEGALNALNSGSGAYGSKVDVTKLNSGSYRVIFKDPGARTDFGGTSIDLAPESEVTIATAVVGSATIRAQMIIEISQQPAIYTSTWTTHANKFNGQLNANTARVQELIATGQDAFFEVKADDDVICQVPIAVLPAVAAPNSLPAHTLPSNLNDFANDPSTNGNFNAANWLTDLLSPHLKAVWGSITGTLSDQTDLVDALALKANQSLVATLSSTVTSHTNDILSNYNMIVTLNNDANILGNEVSSNTTNIATKAPIASPAFTGSAKIGNNDVSSSVDSLAVGNQNTINGNFSLVVGIQNTTHKSGNYSLGDRNEVGHPTLSVGGNSTAIGSDNILKGGNSFIAGNDNSLTEAGTNEFVSSSIVGNNNDISGSQRAFILGSSNTITNADDAVAIGKSSLVTGNNSIALGTGLKDFADNNTVIFGRFNDNPKAASKIVIGAGFSDTARYNAIEIESKGAAQKARSKMIFKSLYDTNSYADDTAAGAAGVELGELYRTDSVVKIRMS